MSKAVIGARAYLGLAEEVTYGVSPGASTHWARMVSSTLDNTHLIEPVPEMTAYGSNHQVDRSSVELGIDAGGDLETAMYFDDPAFMLLLKHAFGQVATVGAGAPYAHTFTLNEDGVVGLSIQQVHGSHSSTPATRLFTGCVVSSFEISADARGFLRFKAGIIAAQGGALIPVSGVASFPSPERITAHKVTGPTWNVLSHRFRDWSIKVDKKLERRPYVGSKITDCPQPVGATDVMFSGTADFVAEDLHQGLLDGTFSDLVLALAGDGVDNSGTLTLRQVRVIKASLPVRNKGRLTFDVEARAHSTSSSAGVELELQNDDADPLV